ncbi:indole-3-glycerol-phosphate synthase [Kibdelosporangium phytohabitans]|uniref:indole-3-glycerol-phosphate synthase n=1 Tax=Kibdelosporangium phytohabitans TaxID=860235 RepID=A0A0N9I9C3_9PSEU|nr:indole-3-glycerol-phosphate synthase [Kibdelosporangium phytohabitans]ALG12571.1 indole-3-glycerol phosphate synthase [Kibdelosporangium phytohabitans]MBE1464194.1 indole-3-glycerol phosphate synthase [Kibdelosporangium phytohabitans]
MTFIDALLDAGRPVIMEVKRRDPHGDDLFGDRSIADIVAEYEAAGAPCLSVVTGRWFGGTDSMLSEVASLTDRPVLQKDFITRRDQLLKARDLGASAVLLTAGLLPRSGMPGLIEGSLELGLTPFVEVTGEAEIDAAFGAGPSAEHCVVAVNNKDIKNRERGTGDLDRSARLLPALAATGTRCPVSASGITKPQDADRLLAEGYRGLLIGTGLLRTTSLTGWLAELDDLRNMRVP